MESLQIEEGSARDALSSRRGCCGFGCSRCTNTLSLLVGAAIGGAIAFTASHFQSVQRSLPFMSPWLWQAQEGCSRLTNRGAYFTVEIGVGTPMQKFDVVADTGSGAVIIPSCECVTFGKCNADDHCFHGTDRSSTFSIVANMARQHEGHSGIAPLNLTFGSGSIEAVVASDVVTVADVVAAMNSGLLLMTDKRLLKVRDAFGGILGLGMTRMTYKSFGEGLVEVPLFVQAAGLAQFSVCFGGRRSSDAQGVLRMGSLPMLDKLDTVGILHWRLGFQGISVGEKSVPAGFCSMSPQARSVERCGAIIDSGTTLLMGPQAHVDKLFEQICMSWKRCQQASKQNTSASLSEMFRRVLLTCAPWLHDTKSMEELPDLHFHVSGASGQQQTLRIRPWAYIRATKMDPDLLKKTFGRDRVGSRAEMKVCEPLIGAVDFKLHGGGTAWLLGTPLFYEYVVNFDLGSRPPSIGFSDDPCGSCHSISSFLEGAKRPVPLAFREINGPMRIRSSLY